MESKYRFLFINLSLNAREQQKIIQFEQNSADPFAALFNSNRRFNSSGLGYYVLYFYHYRHLNV